MEIIIKGSPEELTELLAGLRTGQTAGAKKSAPQVEAAEQKIDEFSQMIREGAHLSGK